MHGWTMLLPSGEGKEQVLPAAFWASQFVYKTIMKSKRAKLILSTFRYLLKLILIIGKNIFLFFTEQLSLSNCSSGFSLSIKTAHVGVNFMQSIIK
jgi:hypothetical protein